MPHFLRRRPAPQLKGHYSVFKDYVRQDFRECCAYCLMPEIYAAGKENFEIDHFRPRSRFKDRINVDDYYNLYWSCSVCNGNGNKWSHWPSEEVEKKGIGFVDFCEDDFDTHFRLSPDGFWIPLTPSAEYTEKIIKLNRPHLVRLRLKIGWTP